MSEKEKKDLEMSFDEMDSVSGGLVADRTPAFSGIGVYDIVDDKTGQNIGGLQYDFDDDAQDAARALGQSTEIVSNAEWAKRYGNK